MREVKIVDNFLPLEEFKQLKYLIEESGEFPFYFQSVVAAQEGVTSTDKKRLDIRKQYWNWYQIHGLYRDGQPCSEYCDPICSMFIHRFEGLRSFLRAKVNFYPYTRRIREHLPHRDMNDKHTAAIFSLNTCDGFTRMENGSKVSSVENRIVFFDGSTSHNSSTTTTASARLNINFNFL